MQFGLPAAFVLLIFLPLLLDRRLLRQILSRLGVSRGAQIDVIEFSSPVPLATIAPSLRARLRPIILSCCSILCFTLFVIALARPQTGTYFAETLTSGRDIMLTLDVSGSMEALDFALDGETVDRLTVLKKVTNEFVGRREGDRIGLVVFGTNAFTQAPLTLDRHVIAEFIEGLETGMAGDGTAIGDGIAVALKRVRDIQSESKVLILVTDGLQTAGNLDPLEAAKIARELGIKIYAIGIGGSGKAPFKEKDRFGRTVVQYVDVPLDEKTLKQVTEATGGKYFNARNSEALSEIYAEIDKLEQREEKLLEYVEYEERYFPFALAGLLFFIVHEALAYTVLLKVP